MAKDSKDPNGSQNTNNGKLNGNANRSLPSFDPKQNQYKNNQTVGQNAVGQAKTKMKREALKTGIKAGAMAIGVPTEATDALLETNTGKEMLDAASQASDMNEGVVEATKVLAKKQLLTFLPTLIGPFFFLIIIFLILFSRDTLSARGDGSDVYEELRQEISSVIADHKYKADVDGTLILATLIGYNDNDELDQEGVNVQNIDRLKQHVDTLAKYQIMTNRSCEYDSSTMRAIASNDDWLIGEKNYRCIPEMEGETYTLSIEQGDYDDDSSGSVYYWNLIDNDFIFEFYNDFMINKDENTSENVDKINEIIDELYLYYMSLLDASDGEDYFNFYNNSTGFWWPVGSIETTTLNGVIFASDNPSIIDITSNYGWRTIGGKRSFHGAIDISGNGQVNVYPVIAAKAGIVVYPTSTDQTQFVDHTGNNYGNNDGGGYGNYVKIDHGNGEYTLYAHLAQNSITVKAGDVVQQGQVIGKIGHSGSSTGPHLHFEVYIGGSSHEFRVDPLNYVNPSDPRPVSSDFVTWIKNVEGGTSGSYVNGDNYVVYDGRDGVLTVGYGIVIVDRDGNQLYTDIYDVPVSEGSLIPMTIVDKIFEQTMGYHRSLLNSYITNNSTSLSSTQYDAILSLMYNCGPSEGQNAINAYGSAKNNEALWSSMSSCKNAVIDGKVQELYGLKLRRAEEYELFLTGDYKYDPLSYRDGEPIKYYDVKSW